MMSLRPSQARMYVRRCYVSNVLTIVITCQTLRFVQSLPKRERVPFSQKLRTTDKDGQAFILF